LGSTESLNASVATGIILYEAVFVKDGANDASLS
jgi:tRNA G18 (ribose-2'-O)-methylase SpoU